MAYLHVLCEGQSEEIFVKHTLAPHLQQFGVFARPVVLRTKRIIQGGTFRGGVSKYSKIRNDISDLLGDPNYHVTTLLDYYGLPPDFPGLGSKGSMTSASHASQLEAALATDINNGRFIPFLALHEFEAWVFVNPGEVGREFGSPAIEAQARQIRDSYGCPEDINDGESTHPSNRLARLCPGYSKTRNGPQIIQRTGLPNLIAACPHLASWVAVLSAL